MDGSQMDLGLEYLLYKFAVLCMSAYVMVKYTEAKHCPASK